MIAIWAKHEVRVEQETGRSWHNSAVAQTPELPGCAGGTAGDALPATAAPGTGPLHVSNSQPRGPAEQGWGLLGEHVAIHLRTQRPAGEAPHGHPCNTLWVPSCKVPPVAMPRGVPLAMPHKVCLSMSFQSLLQWGPSCNGVPLAMSPGPREHSCCHHQQHFPIF